MNFSGLFVKVNKKAEPGSNGEFMLRLNDGTLLTCIGAAPNLKKNIPVAVTGEKSNEFIDCVNVNSLKLDIDNRDGMVRFFSGRSFIHVGAVLAGKIYDSLVIYAKDHKVKDFSWLSSDEIQDALKQFEIDENVTFLICTSIIGLHARTVLYDSLQKYGGSYTDSEALYNAYGAGAWAKMNENPYNGIEYGVPFCVCDKMYYDICQNRKRDAFNDIRLNGMCKYIYKMIENSGSCCMRFNAVLSIIDNIQKKSGFTIVPKAYIATILFANKELRVEETDNYGVVVYPDPLYSVEDKIAGEITRILNTSEDLGYKTYRGKNELDDDQLAAMGFLKKSGVKVITGPPGSGKTTLIQELVSEYKKLQPDNRVYLCAPTGRAAARIKESSGLNAITIHKVLGTVMLENGTVFRRFNKKHKLLKGIYIVDEMSMVDEMLFLCLLEAIPDGSLVILSGDPKQLPSVQAGTVLKDLVNSGILETIELTHIHRQGGGSLVVQNYHKIANQDCDLMTDKDFVIKTFNTHEELMKSLSSAIKKKICLSPEEFQILTITKKGDVGKDAINQMIASKMKTNKPEDYFQNSRYGIGDKIMMTRNNYKDSYWNGDTGIITSICENGIEVKFFDKKKIIERKNFLDMEHAWACTVHKSQGSEYKEVILVIDDAYKNMLFNQIILTAVTRAKEKVSIYSMNNALTNAIKANHEEDRITGLSEALVRRCGK